MFKSNYQCKWIKYIKHILDSTGFSDIWLNQSTNLSKHTHLLVKQTLKDNFLQDWNSQLQNSSKGNNTIFLRTRLSVSRILHLSQDTCTSQYLNSEQVTINSLLN